MYEHTTVSTVFRALVTVNSLILTGLNYNYYTKSYMYKRLKNLQTSMGETFYTSREFKLCLLTNFINLLHAPPYCETSFEQIQNGA